MTWQINGVLTLPCYPTRDQPKNLPPHVLSVGTQPGLTKLQTSINQATNAVFKFSKISGCGTDANVHAILEATEGDTSTCIFAAGSYIGGDDSVLQALSSCCELKHFGPSVVCLPTQLGKFGQLQTVGLPYYIPHVSLDQPTLNKYENMCLHELHIRLLAQRLTGTPYKALLLELCLAGCGAILSDRALLRLGVLAKQHTLSIIVDEIMTGGRTSAKSMLLTQQKPTEFVSQVSHITMGKWLGIGLVLTRHGVKHFSQSPNMVSNIYTPRGVSSTPSCTGALKAWQIVAGNLGAIPHRREQALTHLGFNSNDCWGIGLMIYAACSRVGSVPALENRFLPLLSVETRFSKTTKNPKPQWSHQKLNALILGHVTAWVKHRPIKKAQGITDRAFCQWVSSNTDMSPKQLDELIDLTRPSWSLENEPLPPINFKTEMKNSLNRALMESVFEYKMVGAKRQRRWIQQQDISMYRLPPWSEANDDNGDQVMH